MSSKFESIPFAVTSNLIDRLASADFLQIGKKYGVTEVLEGFKDTIESIYDVLLDADNKQHQARVRKWIRKFKDVLHQADDLLDDLAIEYMSDKLDVGRGKEVKNKLLDLCSSSNQITFNFPIQMAEELKKVREAFDVVEKEGMSELKLSPRSVVVKQTVSGWRETSSFVLESDIIGRDDSKEAIISLLTQSNMNQKVSVIAVVGIGGLGKTTMAQLVYNDLEEKKKFEKLMWVCVSDDFDVKIILRKILESLTRGTIEDKISLDNLQNRVRENLRGKKYLLVLDDIWNEDYKKWAQLRTYLTCGAQDSKVLATTRKESVAKTMRASTSYPLRGLTVEESWSLLKNIAFEDVTKGVNQNLEATGKEIAKKCKGVPLAIKTVGGLLPSPNKENEWEDVLSEWEDVLCADFWKLCEDKGSIMPILELSYQNLSPEMRQCFAYCSLYPKDWTINKKELVCLWMAQGYLKCSTEKQQMEDVGDKFVKTFLMNSFFQDAKCSEYGEIVCFKMHDLMHDLAMLVAGNDCCYLDSGAKKLEGKPMHVSLNYNGIHLLDLLDASRLRTVICRYDGDDTNKDLSSVISNFEYLRVLKVTCNTMPTSIEKLKHLRYLYLSHSIEGPPKSLSNLICLQTLNLRKLDKDSFTEVFIKLVNLRWLEVNWENYKDGMPVGLGKLSSLQFLPSFVVGDNKEKKYGTLNELKDLHCLRGQLTIKKLNQVRDAALESQDVNLKEKYLLESLCLEWENDTHIENSDSSEHESKDVDCSSDENQSGIQNSGSLQLLENLQPHHNLKGLEVSRYPGKRFPNWLSSLTNIVKISLCYFSKCQYLPPLERLPSLKSLEINSLYELEYIYLEDDGFAAVTFFPSLERLELYRCPKLRGWGMQGDDIHDAKNSYHLSLPASFPHLSYLSISRCPNLTCMPPFPTVEELFLGCRSVEPLTAMLNTEHATGSAGLSSSITPLSKLRYLSIFNSPNVKAIPKGWMQNVTSLEFLHFVYWKSETIEEFETGFKDDTNSLPSLREIRIDWCKNLKALPDWICNLSSLQKITIQNCPNLASLPEGMSRLTNLKILEVEECPLLLKECRTETSAVSRLIAHIPEVIL